MWEDVVRLPIPGFFGFGVARSGEAIPPGGRLMGEVMEPVSVSAYDPSYGSATLTIFRLYRLRTPAGL